MRKDSNHLIDLIFPIAVLFVFAVSALAVLMLAANIYEETTQSSTEAFSHRTATAYVLEKVRQNDENGEISVMSEDGIDYLVLHHSETIEKEGKDSDTIPAYTTYIYVYDGQLKELSILDSMELSPAIGDDITALEDLSIYQDEAGLLTFGFTFEDGQKVTINAAERSH